MINTLNFAPQDADWYAPIQAADEIEARRERIKLHQHLVRPLGAVAASGLEDSPVDSLDQFEADQA